METVITDKQLIPKENIQCLQSDRLERYVNHLASFYGHSVYLVGSQLYKEDPRDVDIVIIIPNSEFVLRYINQFETIGHTDEEKCEQWTLRYQSGLYNESNWVWAKDVSNKCLQAMKNIQMNIDFKVYPEYYQNRYHVNSPKLKISSDNF